MGKFRAEIRIKQSDDSFENISFEFDAIQDLSTRTMATNNPTQPVFDVFANQGLLVVKDKDLTMYNNAINGVFDNAYQFDVFFYKGNVLIASHIVNQRPFYDFANKTLTLSLGNSIDNFENIVYSGLKYNFTNDNIKNIQKSILRRISPLSSFIGLESGNKNVSVPYLPEMSSKQALKKTLEATGCSIIEAKNDTTNKTYQLIDMLGRETNGKVNKLIPKHTRKSFTPNIILDNRFSDIAVNATNLYKNISTQEVFGKNINKVDYTTFPETWEASNMGETQITGEGTAAERYCGGFIKIQGIEKYFYTVESYERIYQNLKQVLEVTNKASKTEKEQENKNPTLSIYTKISKYRYIGTLPKATITNSITEGRRYVRNWNISSLDTNINNNSLWELESSEEQELSHLNKDVFKKTFNFYFLDASKDLTVETNTSYDIFQEDPKFKIVGKWLDIKSCFIVGKKYLELSTSTMQLGYNEWTTANEDVNITQVVYEPIGLTISYDGIVQEIKFDKTLQLVLSGNNINKFETEKGNELIQTNLDGTIENSTALLLEKDLYNFYKDGIRTGEIDVIFGDYISTDGTETKDIDTPFEVGDYVIPCKDNLGTAIITKPIPNQTVKAEYQTSILPLPKGEYEGYCYWKATLNSPFKIVEIMDLFFEYPVYKATAQIINDNQVEIYCYSTFSETVMPVYITLRFNDKITPIYKVVDCEINLDGGAGIQRLKLMENPSIILENLPKANEPAMFRLPKRKITIEYENDISQYDLSNNDEKGEEMSINGSNDLIGL